MNTRFALLRAPKYLVSLALLACGRTAAQAQTGTTNVGGGPLDRFYSTLNNQSCHYESSTYDQTNFTSFKFIYGGTTYPISGSAVYFVDNNGPTRCPPAGPQPFEFPLPAGVGA